MVYRRFGVQLLVGLCRTNYLIDLGGIQLRIPIFVPDGERKLMNNCWRIQLRVQSPHRRWKM